MNCCSLTPALCTEKLPGRWDKQANRNSSNISPVYRNLWVEASGAFSYRTEGRRMVKPQQDYLKRNIVRNLEKKGEKEWTKSCHLDWATFILVIQKAAVFQWSTSENISDILFIDTYIVFYFYRDNTFHIHSMDAYSENCFHFTLPYDQGIQAISA